jgi:hypothetical protein
MATNVCMALEIAEDYPATATNCREARAALEESTILLRAVAVELCCRSRNTSAQSAPLYMLAKRINSALDHLEGR